MKHSQDLKLNWHLVYITTAWLGLGKVRVPWPSTPQPRRSTPHQVLWVTLDIVCGRKCLTTVIARYVILNWLPFLNHHPRPYYLEHESQNWQQYRINLLKDLYEFLLHLGNSLQSDEHSGGWWVTRRHLKLRYLNTWLPVELPMPPTVFQASPRLSAAAAAGKVAVSSILETTPSWGPTCTWTH